jgi:hypothetical protein
MKNRKASDHIDIFKFGTINEEEFHSRSMSQASSNRLNGSSIKNKSNEGQEDEEILSSQIQKNPKIKLNIGLPKKSKFGLHQVSKLDKKLDNKKSHGNLKLKNIKSNPEDKIPEI